MMDKVLYSFKKSKVTFLAGEYLKIKMTYGNRMYLSTCPVNISKTRQ